MNIPEWETLEEFVQWYKDNNYPFRPPFEDPVYVNDNSHSYVLFRQGQYQAELYLVAPNSYVPPHSHPNMENIIVVLGGEMDLRNGKDYYDLTTFFNEPAPDGTCKLFGVATPKMTPNTEHEVNILGKGAAFISLERWTNNAKPTSATLRWNGDPVGEMHKAELDSRKSSDQ